MSNEPEHADRTPGLIWEYEEFGLTPGQVCRELDVDVDSVYRLVGDGFLPEPDFPDGFDWHPRWSWHAIEALKASPEEWEHYRRASLADRGEGQGVVQDYVEFGLTPGEACRELGLRVDELMCLVLEGHYQLAAEPDALCWPVHFEWARILELKADPELLAAFRNSGLGHA